MDIITIVWYLSTFLALAAFFFLMACSDHRCGNRNRTQNDQLSNMQAPPTPAPSYSEFAPPSYESVMKQSNYQYNNQHHIFVIPINNSNINGNGNDDQQKLSPSPNTKNNNNSKEINQKTKTPADSVTTSTTISNTTLTHTTPTTPTTPTNLTVNVTFHTINEFDKFGR